MRLYTFSVLPLLALADVPLSICPGFNYGIGNAVSFGSGITRWTVYDDSCKAVDSLTTTGSPCTSGTFGCSAPPVIFNSYRNTYVCRRDPNSGVCGGDAISVCLITESE
ncbi:hypothetical protein BDN72DRAFT_872113 [Pluteus cervinus]|uniref:Uncharacterized protein n=1 Tax=Pluteus cervinus TaxID=181527 RepID=A0ACD3AHF7_9AGAR|nr:hypothetical protein BDN72DRAFT_872113 [Pluteus cervinus]